MKLSENLREGLVQRYMHDLERIRPPKNKITQNSAENRCNTIESCLYRATTKKTPLKPEGKKQCAYLKRYYSIKKNEQKLELVNSYIEEMIKHDISFIERYEKSDEYVSFILKHERINLILSYIPESMEIYMIRVRRKLREDIARYQSDEYTGGALKTKRKIYLHIGGTNSGKTYSCIERLKTAEHGVYAGPLRLLALEIYDKINAANVPCTMLTGEEQYITEGSRVTSATVEMVDPKDFYDIAVIDEAQMINDPFRGDKWLRLITRLEAKKLHICLAPEAESVITRILTEQCREEYEIVRHERNTPLLFEDEPFDIDKDIVRGDALILFSKRAVLDISARLEMNGVNASVIYGNLPPQIRKRQFERFLAGETDVVVATDAIGLGVNLPIRRIIFMTTMKFDGMNRRMLNQYEIRQIAGRAGRRGIYDEGYVTANSKKEIEYLKANYDCFEQISYAIVGFPTALLDLDGPLDIILQEWYNIPPGFEVYRKMEVSELLKKYSVLKAMLEKEHIEMSKKEIYSLISCEVDTSNTECMKLWVDYCRVYAEVDTLMFPDIEDVNGANVLEKAETYYKLLDLYNHFSIRMNKRMNLEKLERKRFDTEELIAKELGRSKKHFLRRCNYCGKILPYDVQKSLCEKCFTYYRR